MINKRGMKRIYQFLKDIRVRLNNFLVSIWPDDNFCDLVQHMRASVVSSSQMLNSNGIQLDNSTDVIISTMKFP
jgi:hypothetical protein